MELDQMDKQKIKKYVMLGLILISMFLSCSVGYKFGAVNTCQNSDGLLLSNGRCINYSSLGYCQFENKIYTMQPGMISVDFNLTGGR